MTEADRISDLYQILNDEGTRLGRDIAEVYQNHRGRVRESEAQAGLEIRDVFTRFFSTFETELPQVINVGNWQNSIKLDITSGEFLGHNDGKPIKDENSQGLLWFENRGNIVPVIRDILLRNRWRQIGEDLSERRQDEQISA